VFVAAYRIGLATFHVRHNGGRLSPLRLHAFPPPLLILTPLTEHSGCRTIGWVGSLTAASHASSNEAVAAQLSNGY